MAYVVFGAIRGVPPLGYPLMLLISRYEDTLFNKRP